MGGGGEEAGSVWEGGGSRHGQRVVEGGLRLGVRVRGEWGVRAEEAGAGDGGQLTARNCLGPNLRVEEGWGGKGLG